MPLLDGRMPEENCLLLDGCPADDDRFLLQRRTPEDRSLLLESGAPEIVGHLLIYSRHLSFAGGYGCLLSFEHDVFILDLLGPVFLGRADRARDIFA